METVKINIVPKGAVKAAHASQGDAPRVVRFELFDELLPYTLDGSEDITLKVVRPDNVEIIEAVTNTEEAYIDVSFSSEMTAIRGVANCEINISKNGADLGSHNFDLNIERDAYGEDITVETAQGVIATFTTGVIDNLVGLKTTFEPKQDLHGYETPWIDSNVVNKTPYLSRALAGTASRIGNYEFNKLVGGTYAFNQLAPENNSSNYYGADATTTTTDGVTTISDPQARFAGWRMRNNTDSYIGNNHKLLILSDLKINWSGKMVSVYYNNGNHQVGFAGTGRGNYNADTWYKIGAVISVIRDESSNNGRIVIQNDNQDYTGQEWSVRNIQMINLTQLFGSTIADYIYNLETAQAGAGVSFFKALFDKDYYPYNAGELMSVKTSAHVTKDANNNVISNIALDPDLELRGIPKLDENNKLYYDGDTYESNGDVTRRLSSVTLDGNLNPNNLNVTVLSDFTQIGYLPYISIGVGGHSRFLCNKNFVFGNSGAGSIYNSGIESAPRMFLGLPASVTTAAEAVAWFANNPTTVLFYIATPTTESADPFTDPQEIDAQGSEEFTDNRSVPIPVGHESYYANICEIEGIDSITFYHSGEDTQDPESVTVEIGQEVYGGYYDKDLGIILTSKLVDLGSLDWYKVESIDYPYFAAQLSDPYKYVSGNTNTLSSRYAPASIGDSGDSQGYMITNISYIRLRDNVYYNKDQNYFKAAMNGVTLCYELETPVIIPAEKVNFTTVKGVNNVWSDTNGETEVKFYVKEA